MTSKAMSVLRMMSFVFSIRRSPSIPLSSYPAVSMKTTGPKGINSMVLYTGSVVVPGCDEITAMFCPVKLLSNDDLPTFVRPNIPMCRRLLSGVVCIVHHLSLCVDVE